jgi:hypothetical protein
MFRPECETLVNVLKTDFEVSSRIAWILAFWRGKRSKRALVMNAIKVLIMAIGVSHSAGSDSMSSGSVSSEGSLTILTGRTGVFSVTSTSLSLGHDRDHAGWGPLQEGQEGSFAGHLLGGWVSGHFGQIGLLVHSVCPWPNWKHLGH